MSLGDLGDFGNALVSGAIKQEVHGLREAVDSGRLVMDPDAAERVAKLYEGKADDVQAQMRSAYGLTANNAYGDCHIGRALEKKFNDKVHGTGNNDGIVPILREAEKILRDMAQAYRDSARDMQNTDDENARHLGSDV